jgi:anti-sigma regulatory factor (Ser/Thr protein kinase)
MATIDPDPPANAANLAATLPGTLEAVTGWTEGVQAFCARHGVAARAATQAALVFEEILTNLVQHGGGAGLTLEASLEVTTSELRGEVVDDGAAFDPLQVPPPDLEATLEERAVGGLGIHLARTLTDDLAYERREGRNRLSFVKRLAQA